MQPPQPNPTATMLLERPVAIDKARLVETLRLFHPEESRDIRLPADGTHPPHSLLLPFAGHVVAIRATDAPLPEGWRKIANGSLHWPGAAAICAGHGAHLVISLSGQAQDKLTCARITTAVAGAFAAAHQPIVLAGLWASSVLNSADIWARASTSAFKPYPDVPTSLWVGLHPFSYDKTGGVCVLTQGLSHFVGRELELTAPATALQPLLQRSQALVTYLAQNVALLRDGSTFRLSPTEQVTVTLRQSERFPGRAVIAGSFETIG